jgi:hypothetical protein
MNKLIVTILVIAVAVGVYFFFAGGGDKKANGEYDTFAECVYDSGMRMYGSVTCGVCNQQRKLLGVSFEHIREIECDPRNDGAQTELCISKDITHTPTWILEDAEGNNITKFEPGLLKLNRLSEISGCPLEKDAEEVSMPEQEA